MEEIGQRLRRTRRGRDLTLQDLAERSGIAYQSINRIERGHSTPRMETTFKLAKALGIDPKWLAFGDGGGPEGEQDR